MLVSSCSSNAELQIQPHAGYEQLAPGAAERERWPELFTPLPSGEVEVTYYFAYACEHCFAFEPQFQRWLDKPRSDAVRVRRVPVGLRPEWVDHARLFYAAKSQNVQQALHQPLFDAIHLRQPGLADDAEALANFAATNAAMSGGDPAAVLQAMDSATATSSIMQDNAEVRAWRLTSTPTVTVRVGGDAGDTYYRITNATARANGGLTAVLDRLLATTAQS